MGFNDAADQAVGGGYLFTGRIDPIMKPIGNRPMLRLTVRTLRSCGPSPLAMAFPGGTGVRGGVVGTRPWRHASIGRYLALFRERRNDLLVLAAAIALAVAAGYIASSGTVPGWEQGTFHGVNGLPDAFKMP